MFALVPLLVLQNRDLARQNVEAFRKATITRNFAWFEKTFAPDYVEISGNSRTNRKAALAAMRKGLTKSPLASLQADVVRVKNLPHGFLATTKFRGTMRGLGNGVPVTLIATWHDDQTWSASKGRWLLRSNRTYDFTREVENR